MLARLPEAVLLADIILEMRNDSVKWEGAVPVGRSRVDREMRCFDLRRMATE